MTRTWPLRGSRKRVNSTYIPASFSAVSDEPFDKDYMNELFRLGERKAHEGDPWLRLDQIQ